MATRAEVKTQIDTHINTEAVLGHKIHPVSDHQIALKLVVDNAVFKDDDASSLLTASNLATMLNTQLTGAGGITVTKSGNVITITQQDTNTQIDAQGLVDLINNSDGNVDAAISTDNTKIKLTAPTSGGGGGSVDATALLALIDNTAGNVDAAASENDNTKIKLTAPASGGSSFNFPSTAETALQDTDEFMFQDDSDSDALKAITVSALKTALGIGGSTAPTGDPTAGQKAYWGGQTSTDFTSYSPTADDTANRSADVRQSGAHFRVTLPVPALGYGYIMSPNSRPLTHAVNLLGSERLAADFTRVQNVVTIASVSYDVWRLTDASQLNEATSPIFDVTVGGN